MNKVIAKANEADVDEPLVFPWPEFEPAPPSPLEKAISIATAAHKGQRDKAGAPYILHPLRVMLQMDTEPEMVAAVLHDTIEDTDISAESLKNEGFDRIILEAVESVTRRKGETYDDFVVRAGLHPLGWKIKQADILDNMNLGRIASLTEKDLQRVAKYHRSLGVIKELQTIRGEVVTAHYTASGGGIADPKVTLVPRGLSHPHALNAYGSAGTILIDFDGILSEAVMPEDLLPLRKILKTGDPGVLHGFNPFWAPFFCPECREVYAHGDWCINDAGYGLCPMGHNRKIEQR